MFYTNATMYHLYHIYHRCETIENNRIQSYCSNTSNTIASLILIKPSKRGLCGFACQQSLIFKGMSPAT